jgi:osmotically inducible protein OsmC
MKRSASAVWEGGLKDGKGRLSTPSRVLADTAYSFTDRFESGTGTNPEELIAAAHAGCFSMALSGALGAAGITPQRIRTSADLTFEKQEAGWTVTGIHLKTAVRMAGGDPAAFQKAAADAKANCPISRLLNTKITLEATLET